jgi:hypothetical protein
LQQYLDRLNKLRILDDKNANHCLLNEYLPGQGFMPHLDGLLLKVSCAASQSPGAVSKRCMEKYLHAITESTSSILTTGTQVTVLSFERAKSLLRQWPLLPNLAIVPK